MQPETVKHIFKKTLTVITVLFFCLVVVFLLAKIFWLNQPKETPFEIVVFYLQLEQDSQREEAEKYLLSQLVIASDKEERGNLSFENVEIFGEKYATLRNTIWRQEETEGKEPIFEETPAQSSPKLGGEIEGVKITLLEKTNRKEGWIFFDFKLPKEIIFEIDLEKEGNWKEGYQWKIVKINSSALISESKIGQEEEIKENIFAKPVKIEEYMPPTLSPELVGRLPENLKSLTLEVEYKNNSGNPIDFYPFSEWRIVDKNGEEYAPLPETSARVLREPTLFGGKLGPNEIKRGYIPFEVPKEFSPEKIIFKNMERKIIFSLE